MTDDSRIHAMPAVAASRGIAALRSCRAITALARALDLTPVAADIDAGAVLRIS